MIRKSTVETILLRIANTILLNAGKVQTVGLLDVKMGIALFLYHYSQVTENKIYSDFADELFDEVLDWISGHRLSSNFACGMTGICWGIRYLTEKKVIDADMDILKDMDTLLGKIAHSDTVSDIDNEPSFFSKGIYFTKKNDNEILVHLLNDLNHSLIQNVSVLPLSYLNSILYVILQVNMEMEIFTDLLHIVYTGLLDSIKGKHYTFPDVLILTGIIEQLKQRKAPNLEYKKWESLVKMLNIDNLNGIFNTGIYGLIYNKLKSDEPFILSKLETLDIEEQINLMMKDVSRKINLYNGLAGVGLTLLNYFQK